MVFEPWQFWVQHLCFTALGALIVNAVRRVNGRKSPRARFIGWFVAAAVVLGYFAGGVYEYLWVNPPPSVYWNSLAMFGVVVGLLVGNVMGAVVWSYLPQQTGKSENP